MIERNPAGCWNWLGHKRQGYGFLWVDGSHRRAHRVSWELHFGPIPEGQFVCHHCDVPSCVNPDHLFLGTQTDNLSDMRTKDRGAKGERHGRARLTAEDVEGIRSLHAIGVLGKIIARQFGVSHATVSHIIHRKNWAA